MVFARLARSGEGRAMAKDMSKVYSEMLTKELVALRAKHLEAYLAYTAGTSRKHKAEAARRRDLLDQINNELATRVANFNLFV